jgi:hypothetical protein
MVQSLANLLDNPDAFEMEMTTNYEKQKTLKP